MSKHALRGWFRSLFTRRRAATVVRRRPVRARLGIELFEDRNLPSASIPLNGFTWTPIGPSPIATGQSPGSPSSTGRLNGIAVDPSDPNVMYVAADTGGIWRTTDGGHTWSPRTDQQETVMQTIAMVNRTTGDTVYAFTQDGRFFRSTDGANTFTDVTSTTKDPTKQIPFGAVVNKLVVVVGDANDQSKDLLYAAVGSTFFGGTGAGIWRSLDGGASWVQITDLTKSPFFSSPGALPFTDVAVDPNNSDIVYGAIGLAIGDPHNGVYRTTNATSANPTWTLLIGGSAFLPGSTPGRISLAVSPVLPSVIYVSAALREDPRTGFAPLLGIFRSQNSGVDWTPVLLANPANQNADPLNYMGISGEDNNVITVSPFSPQNPGQQIIYAAGYGTNNDVLTSTDGGTTWTPIGVGADGVGAYANVHAANFDNRGRLVLATGGGVYRLNSTVPVTWQSLNGDIGPNGLDVAQFNGFALSPTNPDQAVGNLSNFGSLANTGILLHNAVLFSDAPGRGNAAYGWQTVDANGYDGLNGTGQVIYDPFTPNRVYRVTNGNGSQQPVRRSDDGGRTWVAAANGFDAYPFGGGFYVPPIALDPSRPNRLFGGYNHVTATDDSGNTWKNSITVTLGGETVPIPDLPTSVVTNQGGGPIGLTAIGVGRESTTEGSFFVNGTSLFVGTLADASRDANGNPQNPAVGGPQLYVNVIPDVVPWPPPMTTYGNRSWANMTPDANGDGISDLWGFATVEQVLVDPTKNDRIYVYTSDGQVFRGDNVNFFWTLNNNALIGNVTVDWTVLTGNLAGLSGFIPSARPVPLALDTRTLTDPTDDILYAGTARGVWKLNNPSADFSQNPPSWIEVGLDPANKGARSMPPVPVAALSLNTTTGILGAATYGRGAFEIQVRGLIRGQVFQDTNGNGVRDAGEPPIAGVTVQVLDQNAGGAPIAVTTTDANGFYEFRSLRNGSYSVVVAAGAGQIQTTAPPPQGALLNFTEQTTLDNINFGFFTAGGISGVKYEDKNNNGVRDNNEVGLAGFTIYIDMNNNGVLDAGEPSKVTGADGSYSFANVGPNVILGQQVGPYHLREVQQQGFQATNPAEGQAITISLTSGQTLTGQNFGNRRASSGGGPVRPPATVTGADTGGGPLITLRDPITNQIRLQFNAYAPSFRGGVRVATGFFNGDDVPDVVTAPGPGGGPDIRVWDGATGGMLFEFLAYSGTFTGGVYVAVGDVDGDGHDDIITGAGQGGGPHVEAFSGLNGQLIRSFMAYAPSFTGGVTVAAGDTNGDRKADIITGAGPGGGPHVEVFSGANLGLLASFFAYDPGFRGGVFVAGGDVNGDGRADIVTGPGVGGGAHVKAFSGVDGTILTSFIAFPNFSLLALPSASGARVAVSDVNQDGFGDIVVSTGRGRGPEVKVFSGLDGTLLQDYNVFDPTFLGGVFVGGN